MTPLLRILPRRRGVILLALGCSALLACSRSTSSGTIGSTSGASGSSSSSAGSTASGSSAGSVSSSTSTAGSSGGTGSSSASTSGSTGAAARFDVSRFDDGERLE